MNSIVGDDDGYLPYWSPERKSMRARERDRVAGEA